MADDQVVEEVMKLPEAEESTGTITQQEAHKPEDVAAAFFRMEKAKFQMLLSKMAPYQLRRAVMNAVSYPFVDEEYNPESEEEKQFAYLVHELMLNKSIMQLSFEMQQAEKAQNEVSNIGMDDSGNESETIVAGNGPGSREGS